MWECPESWTTERTAARARLLVLDQWFLTPGPRAKNGPRDLTKWPTRPWICGPKVARGRNLKFCLSCPMSNRDPRKKMGIMLRNSQKMARRAFMNGPQTFDHMGQRSGKSGKWLSGLQNKLCLNCTPPPAPPGREVSRTGPSTYICLARRHISLPKNGPSP